MNAVTIVPAQPSDLDVIEALLASIELYGDSALLRSVAVAMQYRGTMSCGKC